jgi:hypothetical protein
MTSGLLRYRPSKSCRKKPPQSYRTSTNLVTIRRRIPLTNKYNPTTSKTQKGERHLESHDCERSRFGEYPAHEYKKSELLAESQLVLTPGKVDVRPFHPLLRQHYLYPHSHFSVLGVLRSSNLEHSLTLLIHSRPASEFPPPVLSEITNTAIDGPARPYAQVTTAAFQFAQIDCGFRGKANGIPG